MRQEPIRVLLVDDSQVALAVLQRMLASSPDIVVVGTATNGRDALELIPRLDPALVCTDYHMPRMDGLKFTKQVMAQYPRPILVISSAVCQADTDRVFALLEAGAMDVFPKPTGGPAENGVAAEQLIKKVKMLVSIASRASVTPDAGLSAASHIFRPAPALSVPRIVAIGASTGGPLAMQAILSQLPARFPLPILCVQHIGSGFLTGLVSWLDAQCQGTVGIAREGEIPQPGQVYFPQENSHLVVDARGRLQASTESALHGHRPSVTVTFSSVARYYGSTGIGVLLTGMGKDGGQGMEEMAAAGALTIAQDETSCVIYGMPRDAVERGAARAVLPLGEIARALVEAAKLTMDGNRSR